MCAMFTNIYPKTYANVGKYSVDGESIYIYMMIPGFCIWYLFLPLLKNTRIVAVLAEKHRS